MSKFNADPSFLIERGQQADRVKSNPDWQAFVDTVRKDLFDQWKRTNVAEAEKREDLFKVLNGLEYLVGKADAYIEVARHEIEKQAKANHS